MKQYRTFLFYLFFATLFVSCSKTRQDILIGQWDDSNNESSITFYDDGKFYLQANNPIELKIREGIWAYINNGDAAVLILEGDTIYTSIDNNDRLIFKGEERTYYKHIGPKIYSDIRNPVGDLIIWRLKGKVESIEEKRYEAFNSFGKLKQGDLKGHFFKRTFNKEGNEIEFVNYLDGGEAIHKSITEYDGLKGETNVYLFESGKLSSTKTIKKSSDGKTISSIEKSKGRYNNFIRSFYEYDSLNNLIKIKTQSGNQYDDGTLYEETISYDKNGYEILRRGQSIPADKRKTNTYSINDELGNPIYKTVHHTMPQPFSLPGIHSSYSYYRYDYEYDKNNNWIRRVRYKEDEPKEIIERKIKYYR